MPFVLLQFSLLIYLSLNISWSHLKPSSIALILFAFLLGIYSIFSMGFKNLSIFPKVKVNAKFIIKGPYKIIRHPMYTALIFFSIATILTNPSPDIILAVFLLVFILLLKLNVEERGLEKAFPEYINYKKDTYRLIPFIY